MIYLQDLKLGELPPADKDKFTNQFKQDGAKLVNAEFRGNAYHKNYMQYLELCWRTHYKVAFSPDIVWHILLTELAGIVAENPEKYRHLFTDSDEKKEIVVPTSNATVLPLEAIITELKKLIMVDIEPFFPKLVSMPDNYELCTHAAFADMVSPYYNYSMYCCGISAIETLGYDEDWDKLQKSWAKLKEYFDPDPEEKPKFNKTWGGQMVKASKTLNEYFDEVQELLGEIRENYKTQDMKFWSGMFDLERCGSGGQVEVAGWIQTLYFEIPSVRYPDNFSSSVSKVDYKELSMERDFTMYAGLFYSMKGAGDLLVPMYGYMVYEHIKE